jgi:hypothetical protein
MRRPLRFRISPSFAIALLALFFALGGSAAALRGVSTKTTRCPAGSVKAIAIVTGNPAEGLANLPAAFSGAGNLYSYRWSCSGAPGTIQVRKSQRDTGASGWRGFDIRFVGNPGKVVLANAASDSPAAVASLAVSDGSFHVTAGGDIRTATYVPQLTPIVVVLF